MIVVECFGRDPVDNIATCLSLRPNKLMLIGEAEKLRQSVERYRDFIGQRQLPIAVDSRNVNLDDVTEVVSILSDIVETGEPCVIDLEGGDGNALAAAGIVYERYKDIYPVTLQSTDAMTGAAVDCDGDGKVAHLYSPNISVDELIKLYGGSSKYPTLPNAGLADINPIWMASISDADQWNRRVTALLEIEKYSRESASTLQKNIDFSVVRLHIRDYAEKRQLFDRLINDLEACGVISIASRAEASFRYRYTSQFACRCMRKQGNVLEHKTLLEARALQQNGQAVFHDCLMSVSIDWDGVEHEYVYGGTKDTSNEIDVLLMHGMTPVFISCKNGIVKDEELYKLNTVAEKFGGERVRKALIATACYTDDLDKRMALQQRAEDMGICFEADAATFSDADWQDFLLRVLDERFD